MQMVIDASCDSKPYFEARTKAFVFRAKTLTGLFSLWNKCKAAYSDSYKDIVICSITSVGERTVTIWDHAFEKEFLAK